ncbi:MAG: hypothetical protein M1321_00900 [Candidatus Marsarchaeota archaeon]|nr:hypothetical protein [Candidatus Marsarchaeota archaeon]
MASEISNVPDEKTTAPKVEKFRFSASVLSSIESMKAKLSKVPFYSVDMAGDSLVVGMVESRNIRKQPYLFYIMNFNVDFAEVIYSIPPDISESLRRAAVLRGLASALSIVADDYKVNVSELMQYVDSTLDKLLQGLSQSYSSLYNKYDSLLDEYRALKRLNIELSSSNRNLTIQATQLSEENKRLKAELDKLQKYSDESLMSIIEEWIEVHNNTIDIEAFSKTYGISAPRAEEVLDKMVSMGYLEVRG